MALSMDIMLNISFLSKYICKATRNWIVVSRIRRTKKKHPTEKKKSVLIFFNHKRPTQLKSVRWEIKNS